MDKQTFPFPKVPLPYPYNGLEPYIDTRTMILHHDKHYGAYVDNLNKFLEGRPDLQGLTIEELLTRHIGETEIRHNGGGVFNHEFFFAGMRPGISQIVIGLSGRLLEYIQRDFGSLDKMREQFFKTAADVFGSGYAWLCAYSNGRLCIVTTANQDTPLSLGLRPLLCIDVWEHAYYLRYCAGNPETAPAPAELRMQYIQSFWHLVDWVKVSERLC